MSGKGYYGAYYGEILWEVLWKVLRRGIEEGGLHSAVVQKGLKPVKGRAEAGEKEWRRFERARRQGCGQRLTEM